MSPHSGLRSHRGQPHAPPGLENGAANPGALYHVVNRRDRREDILVVNCLPVASIKMSFS
jgi:hypothetical protein